MQSSSTSVIARIKWSALCAALTAAIAFVQPIVWYECWSFFHGSRGGQDWSFLAALVLVTIGTIGGGSIGLVAGAWLPGKPGLAASCAGLGMVHLAAGFYFVAMSNEPALFAWISLPAIVVDLLMALAFWRPWRRPAA
jgi:hypothetical protein